MAELSLRDAYQHVVRADDTSGVISLDAFFLRPQGVRHAIEMMVPGPGKWDQIAREGKSVNENWTEECQGVATDGYNWFFSSGGSKAVNEVSLLGIDIPVGITFGGSPIAIYTFAPGLIGGGDGNATHVFEIAKVEAFSAGTAIKPSIPLDGSGVMALYHIGPIATAALPDDSGTDVPVLLVDHWVGDSGQILVLRNDNGQLSFLRWIPLESVAGVGRMGMVAFDQQTRRFITSGGAKAIGRLYQHDEHGRLVRRDDDTERALELASPIHSWMYVQGGALSPKGHLYVSAGAGECTPNQFIYNYSVLTGRSYPSIDVLALEANQELEGICFLDTTMNGAPCQIHAVLLQNTADKDDVFFKSFAASEPDLV